MKDASAIESLQGHAGAAAPDRMVEELAARRLSGPALAVFCIITLLAIAITLNQLLNLQLFVGVVFIESRYLYLLAALLLPLVFLVYGANARAAETRVPWYDWVLAAASVATLGWYAWQAERAVSAGWEYSAPFGRRHRCRGRLRPDQRGNAAHQRHGHDGDLRCRRPLSVDCRQTTFASLGPRQDSRRDDRLPHREFGIGLRHPDARLCRNRRGLHRVRGRAELHGRRKIFQRSGVCARRQDARWRRASRRDLERAAGLDQRERDLERHHVGRRHDPGDETHGLSRRLRGRRRGCRFDRRGTDAARDGVDGVRDGIVSRHALRGDCARGGCARPSVLLRVDGPDRRLCGAPQPVGNETRRTAPVAAL